MSETKVVKDENFDKNINSTKFRSVKKEVEKEIQTLKKSKGTGQRIYKNLFEKRIKDDFRLYYFKS
jgi:hypothetical protein